MIDESKSMKVSYETIPYVKTINSHDNHDNH